MAKKDLKEYLNKLNKKQLEEQILDLYDRFKPVKVFYDFAFNPREDKLVEEAKLKIGKEYFPLNGRKPKMRRSTAQKLIKHFREIEMDPFCVGDVMLFNIETAQTFTESKQINQDTFYKSMLKSFQEAVLFIREKGMFPEFSNRISRIVEISKDQNWPNAQAFVNSTIPNG